MKSGTDLSASFLAFRERYGVPGSTLKYLAITTMFIDHAGASVVRSLQRYQSVMSLPNATSWLPQIYFIMRRVGRIAFPIFCFLLVEGFVHTRNIAGYVKRMALFALLSEFPFDYCLHRSDLRNAFNSSNIRTFCNYFFNKQNVYFTLLIALLVLWGVQLFRGKIAIQLVIMVAGMWLANYMHTDYSYKGVFIIEFLYIMRHFPILQSFCGASFFQMYEKMPTPVAFVPILLYNGKRGRQVKQFFYLFYPAHLLLLGLLTNRILPMLFT